MEKPLIENFTLHSVKISESNGVSLKHNIKIVDQETVDYVTAVEEITIEPDADFKDLFIKLKPIIMKVFKLDSFKVILNNKQFMATESQVKIADKYIEEISKSVKVVGLSIIKWDNPTMRSVKLTAVFTDDSGIDVSINTSPILLSQQYFGVESNLENITEKIIEEAYKYRYEGKKSQLDIPGFSAPESKKTEVPKKKNTTIPEAVAN